MDIKQQIREYAKNRLEIDLIGFCRAEELKKESSCLQDFLERKYHGEMKYLENIKLRTDPAQLLDGVKSVIVIGINYYREKPDTPAGQGRIARYAWGRDYHKVLKKILKDLQKYLDQNWPGHRHRLCTDSAPLMEKAFAQRAGLGFYGKNSMLINPQIGSFFLLGELLTTLEIEPDTPLNGTCGTCNRCMDACPTRAIVSPGQIDARRCISYLTIESKSPIPADLAPKLGNNIFGCDICQEVCPYNLELAKDNPNKALAKASLAGDAIPLDEIMAINDDQEYLNKFAGSPLMRAKRKGLQRNAAVAQNNSAHQTDDS